jgi:putative ABC transport system substrate-binding protein
MKRREFIALLGGATIAWPLATRAQQSEPMRRIGILVSSAEDDEGRPRIAAFQEALQPFGWIAGRNVQIDAAIRKFRCIPFRCCPGVSPERGEQSL